MDEAIKNFAKQFGWKPQVENATGLKNLDRWTVAGMGGSHLAAGLLKIRKPDADIIVHHDYGLPALPAGEAGQRLIIASSYSGNTEETLDAFEEAGKRGLARVAISVGGKLIELAKSSGVPYVQFPDTGIQPRSALGFSIKALLKLMGEEAALEEIASLAETLDPLASKEAGRQLAETLKGYVPVIYTSLGNAAIGYNWKIKFNETAKIPAFVSTFPELNHNEMTGFDLTPETRPLSEKFFFIFLKDPADSPKIQKRMEVTGGLFRDRGFTVSVVEMRGNNIFHKLFSSLLLADWTAYYAAEFNGIDPDEVPMVEEFKRLIGGK